MEPTIYKPSIYKSPTIYKTGSEGGGGGVACIRCTKSSQTNYIQIPISSYSTAEYEFGFNLAGDWGKNNPGIFGAVGNTYYPPIGVTGQSMDSSNFYLGVFDKNYSSRMSIKLYPNNFNFYHGKIYALNGTNSTFELTDLSGNKKINSYGNLIAIEPITAIRLFVSQVTFKNTIAGLEIYYFKMGDHLDLIPDEQNGVPGFTDNVSGNFYGPNVNDGTFEAVKARAPI